MPTLNFAGQTHTLHRNTEQRHTEYALDVPDLAVTFREAHYAEDGARMSWDAFVCRLHKLPVILLGTGRTLEEALARAIETRES